MFKLTDKQYDLITTYDLFQMVDGSFGSAHLMRADPVLKEHFSAILERLNFLSEQPGSGFDFI